MISSLNNDVINWRLHAIDDDIVWQTLVTMLVRWLMILQKATERGKKCCRQTRVMVVFVKMNLFIDRANSQQLQWAHLPSRARLTRRIYTVVKIAPAIRRCPAAPADQFQLQWKTQMMIILFVRPGFKWTKFARSKFFIFFYSRLLWSFIWCGMIWYAMSASNSTVAALKHAFVVDVHRNTQIENNCWFPGLLHKIDGVWPPKKIIIFVY